MKTNKIIAGVSALVMAAANVCAVSAQSVTEEELSVPVQDDTTVSAPADEEAADESITEAEKPEKPERPEKPEISDEDKEESEDTEKPERPEKPEIPEDAEQPEDAEKPERPEMPEDAEQPEDIEKPERPEMPEDAEQPEDIEKPEKPEMPELPEGPAHEEIRFNEDVIQAIKDFVDKISSLLPDFSEFEGFEITDGFGIKELKDMFRDIINLNFRQTGNAIVCNYS